MDIQGNYLFSSDPQVSPPYFFQKKEILSAKSFLLHFCLCFKYQIYSDLDVALLSQRYYFQTVFKFETLKTHLYSASAQYFPQVIQGLDKKATCISSIASLRKVSFL